MTALALVRSEKKYRPPSRWLRDSPLLLSLATMLLLAHQLARGALPESSPGIDLGLVLTLGTALGSVEFYRRRLQRAERACALLTETRGAPRCAPWGCAEALRGALEQLHDLRTARGEGSPWARLLQLLTDQGDLLEAALHPLEPLSGTPQEATAQHGGAPSWPRRGRALLERFLRDHLGRPWALLVVYRQRGGALQEQRLAFLTDQCSGLEEEPVGALDALERHLQRCEEDARGHRMPAMALGLRLHGPRLPAPLALAALRRVHRRVDCSAPVQDVLGNPVLLMALPMTDAQGLAGFLLRLERMARAAGHRGLADAGVQARWLPIDGRGSGRGRLLELCELCRVNPSDCR